jgi:hypothetical protein
LGHRSERVRDGDVGQGGLDLRPPDRDLVVASGRKLEGGLEIQGSAGGVCGHGEDGDGG